MSDREPKKSSAEIQSGSDSADDFNPRASPNKEEHKASKVKGPRKAGSKQTTLSANRHEDDALAIEMEAPTDRKRKQKAPPLDMTTAAQEEEAQSTHSRRALGSNASASEVSLASSSEEQLYSESSVPSGGLERFSVGLRYCCWGLFEVLACSWLNIFLALAPFVYLSVAFGWPQEAVFMLDILAIMAHSSMLKFSAEIVSKEWKHPLVEKFVHLVFRNGTVLILAIFALIRASDTNMQSMVKLARGIIFGTILNRLTVVLGLAFVFGWAEESRKIKGHTTKTGSTFLLILLFAILTPSFFAASTTAESGDAGLLIMSRWDAILLLLACVVYFVFNIKTHPRWNHPIDAGYSARLGRVGSILTLIVAVALVCGAGWFLAGSFETTSQKWGLTSGFLTYVLIPLVINAIEMSEAIRLMWQQPDNTDDIVAASMRATIEMCLFTAPFLVILSWIMGKSLGFDALAFEGGVTFISAIIVHFITADARSNWMLGGFLVFLYAILGVAFFFQPDM